MRILHQILREWRNVGLALLLVGAMTVGMIGLVREAALAHGSVLYLLPVLIAAIRWGLVAALAAAIAGGTASAFFFYPPLYSFVIKDPQEILDLTLFIFVAVVTSKLAAKLKLQFDIAQKREADMRDLYAFSRRLAVSFGVSDIHAAIEDHLTSVMQRKVVLFASTQDSSDTATHSSDTAVPERVRSEVAQVAAGRRDPANGMPVIDGDGDIWLVRAVSPKKSEFGVIAVNLGPDSQTGLDDFRLRVDTVLADATATLERLDVAHAISEARMRSETDQLREALIGSVSHELRTPLASILGAASVLMSAPALAGEKNLRALVNDVRNEAERLNDDIQNLLDATRISSDGIKPHTEWADPADIVNSAIERCRRRFGDRRLSLDVPGELPLVYVDSVLVEQALVQIFDNAAKYSPAGSRIGITARARESSIVLAVSDEGTGLSNGDKTRIWERFFRGGQHAATTSGSGLGLWIATAFVAANGGKISAKSDGIGYGTTLSIELPVAQAALAQMEGEADE